MKKRNITVLAVLIVLSLVCATNTFAECGDDVAVSSSCGEGTICATADPDRESGAGPYIGCDYKVQSSIESVTCHASDGTTSVECSTSDAKLMRVAASITPGSYLVFLKTGGTCNFINVRK